MCHSTRPLKILKWIPKIQYNEKSKNDRIFSVEFHSIFNLFIHARLISEESFHLPLPLNIHNFFLLFSFWFFSVRFLFISFHIIIISHIAGIPRNDCAMPSNSSIIVLLLLLLFYILIIEIRSSYKKNRKERKTNTGHCSYFYFLQFYILQIYIV